MRRRVLTLAATAALAAAQAGAQTPAVSVSVQLFPDRSILGTATPVSFGLPLPPGVLHDAGRVVVKNRAGVEVPAHVSALGAWRTVVPAAMSCPEFPRGASPGSIRSALIQFDYTFSSVEPVTVSVTLGASRTHSIPARSPTAAWKRVEAGTYSAAAQAPFGTNLSIAEPAVYAVLPASWLSCSGLATMTSPIGSSARLADFDRGHQNFFETVINDFNSNPAPSALVNFYTDDEPWLYDRAQTFYALYVRTGALRALREAHRASAHYLLEVYTSGACPASIPDEWCRGFFRLKNPQDLYYKDSKYSYNEALATRYWLTGDASIVRRMADITSATRLEVEPDQPQDPNTFTERHTANALLAPIFEYEATGEPALADYARTIVGTLAAMQSAPMDGRPVNGCFNHYHEGIQTVSFSPWMSSLLAHALLRAHYTLADARVPAMLTGLARCVADRAVYTTTDLQPDRRMTVARYIASSYGLPAELDSSDGSPDPWRDMEHAVDVAYVTALGAFFSSETQLKARLVTLTDELLQTHSFALQYWTRLNDWPANGLPRYRVAPPRKFSWWYKNTGGIGWALDGPPAPAPTAPPGAPTGVRVIRP